MDKKSIKKKIKELSPWFHNLHLPGGIQTLPDHYLGDFPKIKWQQIASYLPPDLNGKTVLDIGCNSGFYSFELAKRGAKVLGVDLDTHYLKQAKWAAGILGLGKNTEFRQMQVYDLAKMKKKFDIIIFMEVFYHLRYPVLGLDIVCSKVKQLLIFQTLTLQKNLKSEPVKNIDIRDRNKLRRSSWPKMAFIENKFAGDPTNWWIANSACVISLMRTCGMEMVLNPGREIYFFKPSEKLEAVFRTWNRSEYLSVTGKEWKTDALGKTIKQ